MQPPKRRNDVKIVSVTGQLSPESYIGLISNEVAARKPVCIATSRIYDTVCYYRNILLIEPLCDNGYAVFKVSNGEIAFIATKEDESTQEAKTVFRVDDLTSRYYHLYSAHLQIDTWRNDAIHLSDPDGNHVVLSGPSIISN